MEPLDIYYPLFRELKVVYNNYHEQIATLARIARMVRANLGTSVEKAVKKLVDQLDLELLKKKLDNTTLQYTVAEANRIVAEEDVCRA